MCKILYPNETSLKPKYCKMQFVNKIRSSYQTFAHIRWAWRYQCHVVYKLTTRLTDLEERYVPTSYVLGTDLRWHSWLNDPDYKYCLLTTLWATDNCIEGLFISMNPCKLCDIGMFMSIMMNEFYYCAISEGINMLNMRTFIWFKKDMS